LPRRFSDRRRGALTRAVTRGLSLSPERHPRILRNSSRRPSEGERRRFAELEKRRDAHAARLGIDPTLIASRAILSNLAHDWDRHHGELMNWQRALLTA